MNQIIFYGKHEHEQAFLHFIIVMSISMPTAALNQPVGVA
jgi:hypothetical protein